MPSTDPPAKADKHAVFVGKGFLLLSGGKNYKIAPKLEIVDGDRLTCSLNS
jgi:hypothetical protein